MFYMPAYSESDIERLLGTDAPVSSSEKIFRRNSSALLVPESYVGIYETPTSAQQE